MDSMVKSIKLKNITISENDFPFVIAEIGNNHNGEMEIAKKLIDEAYRCGVNAVKFQTKDIEAAFPQELLNKNDINLAPSKFEGFGLTLLEALHARVPTITIDNSPMNEIIAHRENGICISSNEIDKIQNQPIYEVNKEEFVIEFSKLIKKVSKILFLSN